MWYFPLQYVVKFPLNIWISSVQWQRQNERLSTTKSFVQVVVQRVVNIMYYCPLSLLNKLWRSIKDNVLIMELKDNVLIMELLEEGLDPTMSIFFKPIKAASRINTKNETSFNIYKCWNYVTGIGRSKSKLRKLIICLAMLSPLYSSLIVYSLFDIFEYFIHSNYCLES